MGRHSTLNKRRLVSFDPKTRISTCLLCDKALKGNLLGNIKRHYVRIHNYNFEDGTDAAVYTNKINKRSTQKLIRKAQRQPYANRIIARNFETVTTTTAAVVRASATSLNAAAAVAPTNINAPTAAYCSSSTFKLNKHEFLKCCVGLVSETNIPFRLFNDSRYFKKIIEPYENAYNLNLDAIRIEELSSFFAYDIKEYIRVLLVRKLISIKIELAAKHGRSIAALNVQYIRDFRIQNLTIGFFELKKRNIAECLKNDILKCLNEYNIDVNQIYALTTDNAAYCPNGMQQLQSELLRLQDFENAENDTVAIGNDADNDTEIEADEEAEIDNENFVKIDMLLKEFFTHVPNVAHAVKHAATDFYAIFKAPLEICRTKVKQLRQHIQDSNNLRRPTLDRVNSWFSTYYMIESLYFLKQFIHNDENETQLVDWYFVETFLEAFKPLVDCALHLQKSEQYIIGDFFRDWLLCETKLEQIIKNMCAKHLYDCMQKCKLELMENEAFLAALYFDPRFNSMGSPFFNDEQRRTAAMYALDLNTRLATLLGNTFDAESNECTAVEMNETDNITQTVAVAHDDPYGALELKLNLSTNLKIDTTSKISQKIENLSYGQRMPFSTNILDYWKMLAFKEKELAQLAQIVFNAPANQFSIGRSIYGLAAILANQRSNINGDTLRNMTFIKINNDIFNII